MRFRPQMEPLEDRHLLAVASLLATASGSLPSPGSYTDMDLELVSEKGTAPVVGIRVDAATGSGFNPSAISIFDSNGSPVANSAIKYSNADFGGNTSSLLLVQLSSGNYTIRVGGDNSSFGSFTCDAFLPGNSDQDSMVSKRELIVADAFFQYGLGKLNAFSIAAYEQDGIYVKGKAPGEIDIDGDGKVSAIESDAVVANYLAGKVTAEITTMAERPAFDAGLVNSVTGSGNTLFTSNPVITGSVSNSNSSVVLQASFDGTNWTPVTLDSDGSFTLDADMMKTMPGSPVNTDGSLNNGEYGLQLKLRDRFGEQTPVSYNFVVLKNDAGPIANDKLNYTTGEKQPLTGSLSSLVSHEFAGYANAGGTFTFVAQNTTLPNGAKLVVQANGSYTYTPGDAFIGLQEGQTDSYSFTYTVKDVMGKTATGNIKITINGENDAPYQNVTNIPTQTTDQNTTKTIDVVQYFRDPDVGDVLSIKTGSASVTGGGSVSIVDGKIAFNPGDAFKHLAQGETANVVISFVIQDSATTPKTVNGEVTVTVTGLNDAPVVVDITAPETVKNAPTSAISVLAGATDPDDTETASLVIGWVGRGTQGQAVTSGQTITFTEGDSVTVSADGKTLTYNPGSRYAANGVGVNASAAFEYQAKDIRGALSNKATVTVSVLGANDPPVVSTESYKATIDKNETIEILFSDLLALASDINVGDTLSISKVDSNTAGVSVSIVSGKVVYNPGSTYNHLSAGKSATDTFTFWVSDGHVEVSGTVTVTINGFDTPLDINNQTLSVTSSGTGNKQCTVQLASTGHSENLLFEIVGNVTGGPGGTMPTFQINADTGVITVSKNNLPDTTQSGQEYVMTVKVTDKNNTSDSVEAVVKIQVVMKNPPVVPSTPLKLTTSEDATAAVTGTIAGVTNGGEPIVFDTVLAATSFKIDGTTSTIPTGYTASVNANTGVVSFNPNGKFAVIPAGKNGILILEYTVKDKATGVSATGTIEITISGVNSQPVTKGAIPNQATSQNTNSTFDVRPYFEDPDVGDVLKVKAGSITVTGGGTATINAQGNIVFNPGDAFKQLPKDVTANATITFVMEDSAGLTVNGTYKVVVTGLNDAPVAKDFTGPSTDKDKATTAITVANTGATDPDTGETATLVFGWVGRGTQGQNITAGTATTVTFTEGDSVTVAANGRITYNPGTRFDNLGGGQSGEAKIEYRVTDTHGEMSANKGTISITVNGFNEKPQLDKTKADGFEGLIGTMGGNDQTINLREFFVGAGLTFDSLVIDPSVSASDRVIEVSLDSNGYTLRVKFLDLYDSSYARTFTVSVRAKNSDGVYADDAFTFKVVNAPKTTVEVVALPVKEADSQSTHLGTHDPNLTTPVDFQVNVGDFYYLEVWVSDTLYTAGGSISSDYSRGLNNMYLSFEYDHNVAKIVGVEVAPGAAIPGTNDYTSTLGLMAGMGGGWLSSGIAANGDSMRLLRIRVEAVGEGNPDFQFIRPDQFDDWDEQVFYFSRSAYSDGLDISNDQVLTVAPSITHAAPAPLLAEETPEKIVTGGVYPRVATAPTNTATNGTVAAIPDNADWIHEWQTHWVELWVKASDAAYFLNGSCDLNYNSNYFTAVEVELSPAFQGNSNPVINDALGKVTGIGGNATQLVSGDGYVLLGRVKFQSVGSDNVAFSEAWFAHDMGISLENVKVTTSAQEVFSHAGKSPRTELWAVPYDTKDTGKIQATDFAQFANAYMQSNELGEYLASLSDYNKDGKVDARDFAFFATNYGVTRESGLPVAFPKSFTQRYVGKTLDADSAETVNKIIDAANKAWQTALGLDRPVDIQIVVQDFGTGNIELANAKITAVDANGLPLKGIITLDSTAAGMGWYSQITEPVANGRYDLFTVLLHEMGHIYGFNTSYDAFNAVVADYVSQLDTSTLHAADSSDLMYATLATGVRKYISELDVAIISSAYEVAQAGGLHTFRSTTAALTADVPTLQESLSQDQPAFATQDNGSLVASLNIPAIAFMAPPTQVIDTDTAMKLHAMGLAVAMPITMQQREESRISFTVEQIYNDDCSFFDMADDDLVTLHLSQDADESELALIDLTMDLDV